MSEYAETTAKEQTTDQRARELPERIVIPPIKGEMVHLRPATIDDIARMEVIEAYVGASGITGKDRVAERGAVNAWVRRSVAWSNGEKSNESGVGDPESRRTIAWSIVTEADHDGDGELDAASSDNVIGMIFLIDIDGWARSARIQVVLGKDYRGRGYSRDIMPRVMTYGFAPEPAGLGMLHLGGRAGTEHAFRIRLPVARLRAVRPFARCPVERVGEPLPGPHRHGHARRRIRPDPLARRVRHARDRRQSGRQGGVERPRTLDRHPTQLRT